MSKIKVCLDAGHKGKYNRSNVVKAYYESDMAWKLHLLLKKYLEQYGIEVILTRSNQNTDLELTARGRKSKGCDLFLSIHSNACDSESVDYPVSIVPLNGKGDAIGQKLADCMESVMGTKQNGKIYKRKGNNGDYYGVIRGAVAVGTVAVILEHSFHTNKKAAQWLLDESNLDKMAQAEAKVIADYFNLTKTEKVEETDDNKTSKGVCNVEVKRLAKGDKNATVKALQMLLIGNGISCGRQGADGSYGPNTVTAVKAYQKKKGLEQDGIVGPATWNKLLGN